MDKLKRAIIKEELVELTGCYKKAIILNQFIYWSQRVSDFDKFINEENARREREGYELIKLEHGWIYKTSDELSMEIMMKTSHKNIRIHIKYLVEKGWISERTNPIYKWDKTLQYRVNISKIQDDLLEIGYFLEGYKNTRIGCNEHSKGTKGTFKEEKRNIQMGQNEQAIPEITTEITNRGKTSSSYKNDDDENKPNIFFSKEDTDYLTKYNDEFKDKYGGYLSINHLKELYHYKSKELLNFYLDKYKVFLDSATEDIKDIGKLFYYIVKNEMPLPVKHKSNNKPSQATNYEQRKYDDDFFNNLYENVQILNE